MVKITPISEKQVSELIEIGKTTFAETFAPHNKEENLNFYLTNSFTVEKLTNELQNKDSQFYFAEVDGQLAGYLKINFRSAQTELQDPVAMEVERIYVLQSFQGKKVGQALMEKALHEAKKNQCQYLWLGVWEQNEKALAFYEKNGFEIFGSHVFQFGDEPQNDLMMKLTLQ
jgi:ribosomal protein S18 acetylase RimI-like enzyme